MNINSIEIVGIILDVVNYAFVFLFLFSLLKVNYFNPIVSMLMKIYSPIEKISIIRNRTVNIFFISVLIEFITLMIYFGSQYETLSLAAVSIVKTLLLILRIIFFAVIGGVILSWVSPEKSNAFLELVIEVSDKLMSPLRNIIPSAGGLDFSPLFILIFINLTENFLRNILSSIV